MHENINVHSNNIRTWDSVAASVTAHRLSSEFSYVTAFQMSQRFCERRAPYGDAIANVRPESGNYCRSTALLTDARSQGTKVASTVARGRKTEGI